MFIECLQYVKNSYRCWYRSGRKDKCLFSEETENRQTNTVATKEINGVICKVTGHGKDSFR